MTVRKAIISVVLAGVVSGCAASFTPSRIERSQPFDTPVRVDKGGTLYQFHRTSSNYHVPVARDFINGGAIREILFDGMENGELVLIYRDLETDTRRAPIVQSFRNPYQPRMWVGIRGAWIQVLSADDTQLEAVIDTGFSDEAFLMEEAERCLQRHPEPHEPQLPASCDVVLSQWWDNPDDYIETYTGDVKPCHCAKTP